MRDMSASTRASSGTLASFHTSGDVPGSTATMYSVRSVQPSAVGRAGAGSGPASPRRQCQLRRRGYGAAVGLDQPVRERAGGARQDPRGGDGMPPAQAPDTVRPGHGPVRRGVFGVFDRAVPGAMPPHAEERAGPGAGGVGP